MTDICGIPRAILAEKKISEEQIYQIKEHYNLYQRLLTSKLTSTMIQCECGVQRSISDRYRCRKTKKHSKLVAANQSMQHSGDVNVCDKGC